MTFAGLDLDRRLVLLGPLELLPAEPVQQFELLPWDQVIDRERSVGIGNGLLGMGNDVIDFRDHTLAVMDANRHSGQRLAVRIDQAALDGPGWPQRGHDRRLLIALERERADQLSPRMKEDHQARLAGLKLVRRTFGFVALGGRMPFREAAAGDPDV